MNQEKLVFQVQSRGQYQEWNDILVETMKVIMVTLIWRTLMLGWQPDAKKFIGWFPRSHSFQEKPFPLTHTTHNAHTKCTVHRAQVLVHAFALCNHLDYLAFQSCSLSYKHIRVSCHFKFIIKDPLSTVFNTVSHSIKTNFYQT